MLAPSLAQLLATGLIAASAAAGFTGAETRALSLRYAASRSRSRRESSQMLIAWIQGALVAVAAVPAVAAPALAGVVDGNTLVDSAATVTGHATGTVPATAHAPEAPGARKVGKMKAHKAHKAHKSHKVHKAHKAVPSHVNAAHGHDHGINTHQTGGSAHAAVVGGSASQPVTVDGHESGSDDRKTTKDSYHHGKREESVVPEEKPASQLGSLTQVPEPTKTVAHKHKHTGVGKHQRHHAKGTKTGVRRHHRHRDGKHAHHAHKGHKATATEHYGQPAQKTQAPVTQVL